MPHPLDGKYLVTSTSDYKGPLKKQSDGETEIRDGQTRRYDRVNCLWVSTFRIITKTEVEMTSTADPAEADLDFLLTRPDGSPTREAVTYKSILKLAKRDEKVQMSGQISYGGDVTFITMRRVALLQD